MLAESKHTRRSFKMARGIITLGDEDIIIDSAFQRLIERYRRSHELFFDLAKSVDTRLELEVVVARVFGNGGDDGDVVALGTDIMRG